VKFSPYRDLENWRGVCACQNPEIASEQSLQIMVVIVSMSAVGLSRHGKASAIVSGGEVPWLSQPEKSPPAIMNVTWVFSFLDSGICNTIILSF
jgi:hypothetical protein